MGPQRLNMVGKMELISHLPAGRWYGVMHNHNPPTFQKLRDENHKLGLNPPQTKLSSTFPTEREKCYANFPFICQVMTLLQDLIMITAVHYMNRYCNSN